MSGGISQLSAALEDRYRLERELGAGGMATVYLAHDLRHRRPVAIKVLHPQIAAALGTDRFLAEIATSATLQHPNILPLFDSGAAGDLVYFVMPLIDGESLRHRLDRERMLPVDDAVRITAAVAGALDYAHRHGVIHRDIKPENILLQDGQPVVADFGIALAVSRAGGDRLTETGFALGTPLYMSPEQAGAERTTDGRSDIYSLGVVCYELLAGEPPFSAPTTVGIVARVLAAEPAPLSSIRPSVPPHVEAAVHRALQKLPADRFATAGQFSDALHGRRDDGVGVAAVRRSGPAWLPLVMTAVLGLVIGWLLGRMPGPGANAGAPASMAPRYVSIALPDTAPMALPRGDVSGPVQVIAISPSGRAVAYLAGDRSRTLLHVASLDAGTITPLPGSEDAHMLAFSPDGEWLAFVARGELRKVALSGGPVIRLAELEVPIGVVWLSNDRILVSRKGIGPGIVPAMGGRLDPLGERFHSSAFIHTQLLPDSEHLLGQTAYGEIATVSLATAELHFIGASPGRASERTSFKDALRGVSPRYLASGYLVYASGASLMVAPFDARERRLTGDPLVVANDVRVEAGTRESQFAVADDGTVVYAAGRHGALGRLIWSTREGVPLDTLAIRPLNVLSMRLSPDGRRLAVTERLPSGPSELRIFDLRRGTETRTRLGGEFQASSWSVDGGSVTGTFIPDSAPARACCFVGGVLDLNTLVMQPSATRLAEGSVVTVYARSADGGLRCLGHGTGRGWPLGLHSAGGRTPWRLLTPSIPGDCAFSPDGRWVAYSNRDGIFITTATADPSAAVHRVSPAPLARLRWASTGRELLYRAGTRLFSLGLRVRATGIEALDDRVLFERHSLRTAWDVLPDGWDLAPDGRLLLSEAPVQPPVRHLRVITNVAGATDPDGG